MICTDKQKTPILDDNTIKEVVKHRRPKRSEALQPHTDPGDNSKYLRHSMAMMSWERPDMESVEQVNERIEKYFALCDSNDMKPSIEGLSLAFDTDRKTLWRWVNGVESQSMPDEVRRSIKKAHSLITNLMVEYMQNGKINPVSGIFLMKNNMGYMDQSEIVITPNSPLGSEEAPETITQKYAELPNE